MTFRRSDQTFLAIAVIAAFALPLSCSSSDPASGSPTGTGGNSDAGSGSGGSPGSGGGGTSGTGGGLVCVGDECLDASVPEGECGDGEVGDDEACDDGNALSGDGCTEDCLGIETGYACPYPGQRCIEIALCGDGIFRQPEQCDDGNLDPGDGCSARCKLELGFACAGDPSVCTPTTCGDGNIEGTESCDDGNLDPFDGCSSICQLEPDCSAGACTSACGDGLVIGEECDDLNNISGDGCSADCTIEDGFECIVPEAVVDELEIPIVYRDFRSHNDVPDGHPNFHWAGTDCTVGAPPTPGLVELTLDADRKPVYSGTVPAAALVDPHIDSQDNFQSWYRDSIYNITYSETMTLTNVGEKFTFESRAFFPLEDRGWTADATIPEVLQQAYVPPATGDPCVGLWTVPDPLYAGDIGLRNFFFTSEVRYWFEYDPAVPATLDFYGDDDVWVYVNGRLVVDLGGIHAPAAGSVTIDDTTQDLGGTPLGLVAGEVYEVVVFQAERNPGGSMYRLELQGFNALPSLCTAVCGDGIVGLGEECDDGVNDGGYGECAEGCVLDAYCGDGIVQSPPEDCDDGNRADGDACGSSCRILVVY